MRRTRAQSIDNIVVVFVVLVPVILVLLDIGAIWIDAQANEALCKSAASAAASGDFGSADQRAESVIELKNKGARGPLVKRFVLIRPVVLTGAQPAVAQSAQSRPVQAGAAQAKSIESTGPAANNVAVTTEVQIKTMLVHFAFGGKTPLPLRTTQTCPISKTPAAH